MPTTWRPPTYERAWTTLMVRADRRCQGIGSALLATNAAYAAELGKTAMSIFVSDARSASVSFLAHRGFVEDERLKSVALRLDGLAPPDVPSPTAAEAVPYEEWRAFQLDAPETPHEACFVAVAGDEVVGWVTLELSEARPRVGYHDMTGVKRAWRGRGVASALKRAAVAWAVEHRVEVLETDNDDANAPMRAVNARLGYLPLPDTLVMRAPLPAG